MPTISPPLIDIDTDIRPGIYTFWTLTTTSSTSMCLALERHPHHPKITLWGHFNHTDKEIIFLIDDISPGARIDTPSRMNMSFTWRARSSQHGGAAMLDDAGLRGNLGFCGDNPELRPVRDVEMYLDGAAMWREGYIEAKRQGALGRDEGDVVREIRTIWEEMGRATNRVDMALLRELDGVVVPLGRGRLGRSLTTEL